MTASSSASGVVAPVTRPFCQVDVFTLHPTLGNPLAVVLPSSTSPSPTEEQMHAFAKWTNLSETIFLLPPTDASKADYRNRIFTPHGELPFAGHPTLGGCWAWKEYVLPTLAQHPLNKQQSSADRSGGGGHGEVLEITQECGIGLVPLRLLSPTRIAFLAPNFLKYCPAQSTEVATICSFLSLDPTRDVLKAQWIDNGPGWIGLLLRDAKSVLEFKRNDEALAALKDVNFGIIGPYAAALEPLQRAGLITSTSTSSQDVAEGPGEESPAYELRTFFGPLKEEDPVTGSFNAGMAKWLIDERLAVGDRWVNAQGTALGRKGRVYVEKRQGDEVWIAGDVVEVIKGTVTL